MTDCRDCAELRELLTSCRAALASYVDLGARLGVPQLRDRLLDDVLRRVDEALEDERR